MGKITISVKEYADICLNCKKSRCSGGDYCEEIKKYKPENDHEEMLSRLDWFEINERRFGSGKKR